MGSAFATRACSRCSTRSCTTCRRRSTSSTTPSDNDNDGAEVAITADPDAPAVAMAFKLVEESFGQLTYARVYQGRSARATRCATPAPQEHPHRPHGPMHANDREDVEVAGPGDIVAFIGVDCASGDTFCDDGSTTRSRTSTTPEPVISLAVSPRAASATSSPRRCSASSARTRPSTSAPTRRPGETIIAGVGELQLEVYIERIRREYGCRSRPARRA
jgi:elongation factor G